MHSTHELRSRSDLSLSWIDFHFASRSVARGARLSLTGHTRPRRPGRHPAHRKFAGRVVCPSFSPPPRSLTDNVAFPNLPLQVYTPCQSSDLAKQNSGRARGLVFVDAKSPEPSLASTSDAVTCAVNPAAVGSSGYPCRERDSSFGDI